jgi:hypothetical protein
MTKETEAKWAERVREWRASGLSAEDFSATRVRRVDASLGGIAAAKRDDAGSADGGERG